MKCTNKFIAVILSVVVATQLCACSSEVEVKNAYDVYEDSYSLGLISNAPQSNSNLMASSLCVTNGEDFGTDQVESSVASGAGLFNIDTKEVLYSQSINEKLYPASTTKILTAYCAIKYGDLEQKITVSENACNQASDSSICKLNPGDTLSLRQLLYGLMLRSGNDAAVAIAEGVSGDVDSFVALMNEEAARIGASHSHFVTPNGLHDPEHYTTVYDMYLITNEALKYSDFVEILQTGSYDVYYLDRSGNSKQQTWTNTCGYLSGYKDAPDGITVIGGKTGTTFDAGYCLVCYSVNERNEHLISIVFKANGRANLYYLMNQILEFGR